MMIVFHEVLELESSLCKPMFHDVTAAAHDAVAKSKLNNGTLTVYSQHTTCSVMIQEESHDALYDGTKYLLQDTIEVLAQLVPTCDREGQYLHPGPEHIKHATTQLNEQAVWSLNTDAHLRSSILGRSETIPVVDGRLEMGEFGQIYFVDFDHVRPRKRKVRFQLIGE